MYQIILALAAGVLTPTQISVNAELNKKTGSSLFTTFFSFLTSSVTLLLALIVTGIGFSTSKGLLSHYPLWIWTGGFMGLYQLFIKIFSYQTLGSVQTMILLVCGQVLSGLFIDHFGLFHSTQISFTLCRVVGALLVITGVIISSIERTADSFSSRHSSSAKLLLRFLAFSMGIASASQTTINGYLGRALGSSIRASAWSFSSGTVFLILPVAVYALCLRKASAGKSSVSTPSSASQTPWWTFTGGVIGAFLIFSNAYLSPRLGTGLTVVLTLTSSITGSLFIDHFGLMHAEKKPITLRKILGVLIMIVGTVMIRLL